MSAPVAWTICVAAVWSKVHWEHHPLLPAKPQPADDSEESEVLEEDEESELSLSLFSALAPTGLRLTRTGFSCGVRPRVRVTGLRRSRPPRFWCGCLDEH